MGTGGSEHMPVSTLLPPPRFRTCAPPSAGSTAPVPTRLQRALESQSTSRPWASSQRLAWELLGGPWRGLVRHHSLQGLRVALHYPVEGQLLGKSESYQDCKTWKEAWVGVVQAGDTSLPTSGPVSPTPPWNHGGLLTWAGATCGQ